MPSRVKSTAKMIPHRTLFMRPLRCVALFRLEILFVVAVLYVVAIVRRSAGNGPFRFRKSWTRAPADGAQLGQPPNPPAQAGTVARWARGAGDITGAHGCRHRCFDDSFYPRLRAHRPTVKAKQIASNTRRRLRKCHTIEHQSPRTIP